MRYTISADVEYNYFLLLNPIMASAQDFAEFGPFYTREDLKAFYDAEKVEPYEEQGPDLFNAGQTKNYHKFFRKGGQLEWMNPLQPSEWEKPGVFQHGIHEAFVRFHTVYSKTPIG